MFNPVNSKHRWPSSKLRLLLQFCSNIMIMIIYHAQSRDQISTQHKRSIDVRLTFSCSDLHMMIIFMFRDVILRKFLQSFDTFKENL